MITQVKYASRSGWASRMNGGIFQGSNTSDFSSGVVNLFTIRATAKPSSTSLTTQAISNSSTFQYVRSLSPAGSYGNISVLEFWGTTPSSTVNASFEAGTSSLSNAGGTKTSNNIYTSTNGIKFEALNQYSNGFTLPTAMGNQALHTNNYGETIRITRTNGGSFNLSSIDFVTGQYESWATGLITIRLTRQEARRLRPSPTTCEQRATALAPRSHPFLPVGRISRRSRLPWPTPRSISIT